MRANGINLCDVFFTAQLVLYEEQLKMRRVDQERLTDLKEILSSKAKT